MLSVLHYAPKTFKMWSYGLTLLKFDHFTATQILRENKFWWIQKVQNCYFCLEVLNFDISKFYQISKFRVSKLPKMTFLDFLNLPKLDFKQNLSGSKMIKFQQSQALTSHFESFLSIVVRCDVQST